MATITPIIDDKTFAGSDKGLAVPLRRTSAGAFALRISNLAGRCVGSKRQS